MIRFGHKILVMGNHDRDYPVDPSDADPEFLRIYLDQLAEIDPSVGDVIEYRLGAVALELHVSDLHVQTEFRGNPAGLDHGVLLTGDRFLPLGYVQRLGLAVYLLQLGRVGIDSLALHLPSHDRAFEGHDTKVVAVGRLHDHQVTCLDALPGRVEVYSLTGILEAYLEQVLVLLLDDSVKPVVRFQLAAALAVVAFVFPAQRVLRHRTTPAAVELYAFVV